jgi:hypothetical protein
MDFGVGKYFQYGLWWVGLRNGWMGGFKEWVDGWVRGGFAKVDNGFWVDFILTRADAPSGVS